VHEEAVPTIDEGRRGASARGGVGSVAAGV